MARFKDLSKELIKINKAFSSITKEIIEAVNKLTVVILPILDKIKESENKEDV